MNSVDAAYRSDLRELNELNFARFRAELGQRLAELEAKIETRIATFEVRLMRWMFAYWTGTMLALAGFVYAMVHAR